MSTTLERRNDCITLILLVVRGNEAECCEPMIDLIPSNTLNLLYTYMKGCSKSIHRFLTFKNASIIIEAYTAATIAVIAG